MESNRIGYQRTLMCVKICRGEEVKAVDAPPTAVLRIHPVEDLLGFVFKLLDLLA